MTRKRNKPTESWISKTKNELEHSQEIAIKQAYEVGKIRGKKETTEKACNVFCHVGCPHKTESYNCVKAKCDTWKIFKRLLEEQI